MPENINDENTRSYQAQERTGGRNNDKKKKMIIGGVVGAVVLVAVILIIVFATGGKGPNPPPTPPDNPHDPQNHQEFNPMKADTKTAKQSNFEYSIVLDNTKAKPTPTPTLLIQEQQKDAAKDSHDVYSPVNPESIPVGEVNNKWIEKVQVELNLVGENHAHLQLFEQGKTEYKTPDSLFTRPSSDKLANIEQTFNISTNPFSFQIMDRTNEKAFIQTNNRKLVIQDKFKEMGFEVKSKKVYGLGLSNRQFSLETGAYTMYSKTRVEGSVIDTSLGGQQGPAVHPFIMFKTEDDQFAGIYFPNSAPAQFEVIQYDGYDWTIFNYITVSGTIEAYFIMPDSAENVLAAYHRMIGMPAFPPIHALGFYQGSDSYNSTDALKKAQKGYDDGHFMLEGFNLDNYNVKNQIFTVDTAADKFDGIKDWVKSLNKDGRSLIIGLIEGVSQESDAYTKLMADNALLMVDGTNAITNMLGDVMVAYPDWFSSKTPEYYAEKLASLETMLEAFQGINLADNTSFGKCSGVCMPKTEGATAVLEMVTKLREKRFLFEADAPTDPKNEEDIGNYTSYTIWPDQKTESLEKMPFQMGLKRDSGYQNNTVSIEATHPSLESDNKELYYHNINAYQSVVELAKQMMTSESLKSHNKKRPFIMSDSTFPGAGNSTGSWLSDYHRTWEDMRNSIAQVMNLNMFGVLLAGNEVCGSLGEFDAELCARWTQNAVLMPAVRNYYNSTYYNTTEKAWKANPQGEFFQINNDDQFEWRYTVNQAIKQRYSFISYIYTQLYVSHRLGRAYVRPVFFDEPQSATNLADPVEDSYLAGEALHVSTILEPGVKKVNTKFPMGRWVRLSGFMNEILTVTEGNNEQEVDILSGESIIHMKEGFAIPFQPEIDDVKSTQGLLETHTDILIFRDETGFATGHFMIDDGVSIHDGTNFALIKIRLAANTLQFQLDLGSKAYSQTAPQQSQVIRHVKILNATDLAGTDFACIIHDDFKVTQVLPVFNEGAKTLELRSFGTEYFKPQEVTMIRFGDSSKETNICNVTTSFKYKVQDSFDITKQTGTSMTVPLENLERSKDTLSAVFTLLDDMGTVKVMFSRDGKTPADQTAGIANEGNFKITNDKLKVTDFVSVDMNPFRYTVKATDGTVLYAGANLFFFNPENHLITTFDNFQTNDEVGTPLYGIGGRKGNALVDENANTMFTTWTSQGSRAYQPFYIYQQKSKEFVGVFDLSTVAMDYQFDTTRDAGEVLLQHISTGAGLQKYVFRGATPGAVVAKFQQLVGMPMVPPEWAFGWAHYQEGVNNGKDWAEIPEKYFGARMFIDSLWASIDYTDNFEALSVNEARYGNLTKNITAIHHKGVKVVPIIESGISMNDADSNTAQTSGAKADAFIKTPDGKIAVGSQHGNKVNYPDVTKGTTKTWWKTELAAFNSKYGFDGIWLDKNDLYSDCSGFCSPQNILENDPKADIENQIGYVPGGERLDTHSLDVSAVYTAGTEFELHNKFPLLQAEATMAIYDGAKTRPFLISSTSTAGQSASSVSMSAYNTKTPADMEQSVQDLFMANIYGMPFHGSDVCGFYGEKIDQSLCGRWYLLASMQPFARYANSQQTVMGPWEMTDTLKTDSTKQYTYLIEEAMNLKYSLMRYTISFFHGIAQQGGAYYKPLFFDFPNDLGAYTYTSQNIMLGDSIKMSFNPTSVNYGKDPSHFYFPAGNWCQLYPKKSGNPCEKVPEGGKYMTTDDGKQLTVAEDQIFLHMKEGSIVPFTNVDGKAINVAGLLNLPTSFYLGPPSTTVNKGYLAFDDNGTGDDLLKNVKTFELKSQVQEQAGEQVIFLNFTQISGTPVGDKYVKAVSKSQNLGLVQVFDVASLYEKTKYNVVQCIYNDITSQENVAAAQVTYDKDTESLSFDFTDYKSDRIDGEGINMAYLHYCRVVKVIE